MIVNADDLDTAVSCMLAALEPATGQDWSAKAGELEWDCWHTAEHLGDCLLSYAGQLAARPGNRYVRFLAAADKDASPAEVLEFAMTGGRILAAMIRASDPDARAYHPTGMSGPGDFAVLGCVETLLHGEDIALGLGRRLDPPRDICARVLAARFPDASAGLDGVDPWAGLQWATGRIELPAHPRLSEWQRPVL